VHEARGQVEAHRIFSQKPRFTVEIDIVAVVSHRQPGYLNRCRGAPPVEGRPQAGLKVHVLCLVTWSVGVGNIGGNQLLADADHIHILLEAVTQAVDHDVSVGASGIPFMLKEIGSISWSKFCQGDDASVI